MFRILSFVLCLVAASEQLNITKFYVPPAVEVGKEAELVCEHDSVSTIVKWWWKSSNDNRYQLYQHKSNSENQQVLSPDTDPSFNISIKTKGVDNLILWDLQPGHSGTFECEVSDNDFQERRYHSDMVVYSVGDGPQLSFFGEEEVLVACEAFGVAPKPDILISYNGQLLDITPAENATDGLYDIFVNATLPREDIEGAEITCQMTFNDPDIPSTAQMVVSEIYHSDGWVATTTAEPENTTEVQAAIAADDQLKPNGAGRAGGARAAMAALAASLLLRPLLLM